MSLERIAEGVQADVRTGPGWMLIRRVVADAPGSPAFLRWCAGLPRDIRVIAWPVFDERVRSLLRRFDFKPDPTMPFQWVRDAVLA